MAGFGGGFSGAPPAAQYALSAPPAGGEHLDLQFQQLSPEQIKRLHRDAKLPESLINLLAMWPEGAKDAQIQAPQGVEVKDGLVRIQISITAATPEVKATLLQKLKDLGLVEMNEVNARVLTGRLPVAKLDELLALKEVDLVQPAQTGP